MESTVGWLSDHDMLGTNQWERDARLRRMDERNEEIRQAVEDKAAEPIYGEASWLLRRAFKKLRGAG